MVMSIGYNPFYGKYKAQMSAVFMIRTWHLIGATKAYDNNSKEVIRNQGVCSAYFTTTVFEGLLW